MQTHLITVEFPVRQNRILHGL